jgi:hypothetical protein
MVVDLAWADLEPRTKPFDRDLVRAAIDAVVRAHAGSFGRPTPPRAAIAAELDRAILQAAGSWALGWRWTSDEPGGGGPGSGWHTSVFFPGDREALATATRAFAKVVEWREFLEKLDAMFAMLRAETGSLPIANEVELAASRLLPLAIRRTQAWDAWYTMLARTLGWYLESAGIGDATLHRVVATIIEGRFERGVVPDETAARAACVELGARVAERVAEAPRDALADWRRVRAHPIEIPTWRKEPTGIDAHQDYLVFHDLEHGADRAERMAAALLLCRDSATAGMALSFDQLAEWQRIVLGAPGPVPFRTTDAFAKRGRECYRFRPDLHDAFDRALAEAGDPTLEVAVRAARVYLDVCYFHPFADGNARAARLALDHVLTSAGLVLRDAAAVFALPRATDEPDGLWHLAHVIERSLGARIALT